MDYKKKISNMSLYEKKYNEALKWIESIYTELNHERQMEAEAFFPELKKSEDDESKKWILEYLHNGLRKSDEQFKAYFKTAIAWFEKQGKACKIAWHGISKEPREQEELLCEWDSDGATWHDIVFYHADTKTFWNGELEIENVVRWAYLNEMLEPQNSQILANSAKTCKVEPKFKVGDWVLWDNKICYHINDIHQGEKYLVYTITDTNNLIRSYAVECFDKNARIWTIDDAKDGDILASAGVIFIFNKVHSIWISCHCSLHKDKSFIDEDYNLMHIKYSKEVYPATKEECDLLFKKMKEAGYEWDAEKKELKKIDQKSVEENKGNVGKTSSNCSKECEKIITASLLQNNGFIFSEERFETHECYYKELNNGVDVSLLICYGTDKWLLEIMFNNCEQELVKFVSTVKELQKCLDIMGVELKIKY